MSDDIELGLLSGGSSRSSSSNTLFDRSRLHPGYGASKLPVKPSSGATVGAGSAYNKIFEGQLGTAAAESDVFGLKAQRSKDLETQRIFDLERRQSNILYANEIKPPTLNWNKQTKSQYPKHWKQARLLRDKAKQPVKQGLTLPFSKNIGPGNSIQPALTRSDSIAAGHDLHYQHSKKDSDVLSADREAISHFAYEAVNPADPISQLQAGIGLVGLGAKNTVESLSGKVYYGNYVFTLS